MGKTIGVILARLQPIHNGHLELIKESARSNEETFVFVGSAEKFNKRNPIPISLRMQMANAAVDNIRYSVDKKTGTKKEVCHITLLPLDDLDDESNNSYEWGFYLYTKIIETIGQLDFTLYYSDGFENIATWFPGFILREHITLHLAARGSCANGISATAVRRMIEDDDPNLKNCVPEVVYNKRDNLKSLLEAVSLKP